MGKIRIKTLGDEEQEKKQKEQKEAKKQAKLAEKKAVKEAEKAGAQPEETKEQSESLTSQTSPTIPTEKPKAKKEKFQKPTQRHSKSYKTVASLVDKTKTYPLNEALELLEKLKRAKFDETVELHINTIEAGVSGNATLPHGTGKKTRVVLADEEIIKQVESGKIDFDVLIATPDMMPKLAKVAKVLGPKGLMPNPKNGTITGNPEEVIKKYDGGQIRFKTESKIPVIHLSVGKMSFGGKKLEENIRTILQAIQQKNIRNITLKSTMSPGIKITL